jgi:hypothetical protein
MGHTTSQEPLSYFAGRFRPLTDRRTCGLRAGRWATRPVELVELDVHCRRLCVDEVTISPRPGMGHDVREGIG